MSCIGCPFQGRKPAQGAKRSRLSRRPSHPPPPSAFSCLRSVACRDKALPASPPSVILFRRGGREKLLAIAPKKPLSAPSTWTNQRILPADYQGVRKLRVFALTGARALFALVIAAAAAGCGGGLTGSDSAQIAAAAPRFRSPTRRLAPASARSPVKSASCITRAGSM